MIRLLFLSILLTSVYSWEDLKRSTRLIFGKILRRRFRANSTLESRQLDEKVTIAIMAASLPMGLIFFLLVDDDFFVRLTYLTGVMFGLVIVSVLCSSLFRYVQTLPALFSGLGKNAPVVGVFASAVVLPRMVFAKFIFFLALPFETGVVLKLFSGTGQFLPNHDLLIKVLIGALLIRVAIELLEWAFRWHALPRLFSYFRVVLGIILVWLMLAGTF